MKKIFVQIASYRDPELIPTIKDCIEKSKYPNRLTFGICWQHSEDDLWDNLDLYKNDCRFKILDIDYKDSKGVCWARNSINKLYDKEYYTLQIDSHTRFEKYWDYKLESMFNTIDNDNAIITAYPPNYNPNQNKSEWHNFPQKTNIFRFDYDYPMVRPVNIDNYKILNKPISACWISAGFLFTRGHFIENVIYDPNLYFTGEEFNITLRAYTKGYDMYHPHIILLYHYYYRMENKKHWSDNKNWHIYDKIAKERLNFLINNNFDLGVYGLGLKRNIEDYKNFSGVDLKNKIIHLDTREGKSPPIDDRLDKWDYSIIRYEDYIEIDFKSIFNKYDILFISLIVLDSEDIAIYRIDLDLKTHPKIFSKIENKVLLSFEYIQEYQNPTNILIWPHTKDGEWLDNFKIPFLK
jgi:hypothetical protein